MAVYINSCLYLHMKEMQSFFVTWFPNTSVHSRRFELVQDLDVHLLKVAKRTDKYWYDLCVLS